MSSEQIVIRACLPGEVQDAEMVFLATHHAPAGWLGEGVRRGIYAANTVEADGVPRYVIIWHKNDQSTCHINAVAQLNGGKCLDMLIAAIKAIAIRAKCAAIEGLTARAGLVKQLQAAGYKVCGVQVRLEL